MNRDYRETGFDNLIRSIEFNMYVVLLKCFMESLRMRHYLYNEQTSCSFANMFYNQKLSIISAHVLMIEASKLKHMLRDINGLTL